MTTILVTAGAEKYVGGTVIEKTGRDITAATFDVCLGSATYPSGTWLPATVNAAGANSSERVVKLMVKAGTPADVTVPGQYWVWVRVHDVDEVEPLRIQGPVYLA